MKNNNDLLKRLHEIAISAKQQKSSSLATQKNEDIGKDNVEIEKFKNEARKIVSESLTEKEMIFAASKGETHFCVKRLDKEKTYEQLDLLEKSIFDEINNQGFKALIISHLDSDADDWTDYYIGIQWRDL